MSENRLVLTRGDAGAFTAEYLEQSDTIEIVVATMYEGTSYFMTKEEAERLYEWLKKKLGRN